MPGSDSNIKNKRDSAHHAQLISPELLMDAPIGIYTTTPEGRFLSANRTMARMLGYDTPEALIESITDLRMQVYADPDDRQKVTTLLEAYGEVRDYECHWLRRSGKTVWVSLNARTIKDESGNIIYYQGFASNITKRKHNEQDLRKIEWMLSDDPSADSAYDLAPGTNISPYGDLTNLNTSRLILDSVGKETLRNIVNDFLDMLGTSAAIYERNGDYAMGIFSSDWCRLMDQASYRLCKTDDREQALSCGKWLCHESCWNTAKQAIETGAPVDVECEGGIRLYAVPIRASGEIIGTINVGYGDPPTEINKLSELAKKYSVGVKDLIECSNAYESRPPFILELAKRRIHSAAHLIGEIVERTQAEEALKESETTYRALFENSIDAIFLTAPDGQIFDANKAAYEMTGMTESEIVAGGRESLVDKEDPRLSDALKQKALNGHFKGELNFKRKDGTRFPVEISTGVYKDRRGKERTCIIARDTTERKQIEDALRESEEKFRQLFESSPISLWEQDFSAVKDFIDEIKVQNIGDLDSYFCQRPELLWKIAGMVKVLDVNPATLMLYQAKSKEEFFGKITKVFSKESIDGFLPALKVIAAGEKSFVIERDHVTLTGKSLKVQLHWRVAEGHEKTYSRVIVSIVDITQRKRAEAKQNQALSDLERRTKELEALLDGAKAVIEKDDFHNTARRLFDSACDITGARSGYVALLNESGEENEVLFLESGGLDCTVDPHLPMPIRGLRSKAYETGKAVFENDFMNSQWVDFMPAGHVVLKNVLFAPLNIEGKTVGIIGLANKDADFTEEDRQMAEAFGQLAAIALFNSRNLELLKESEKKYRSILEDIEDGYFETDLAGNLTFFNDSMWQILGYSSEELMGMNYRKNTSPDNAKKVFSEYNQIYKTGKPLKTFEWEYIKKNGEKCYLDTSVSLKKNRLGEPIGFRGVARDVTARKQVEADREKLQAQLNQAQKMESVGRLAGGVAHDFNNKLTIINSYAEMAIEMLDPSDPLHEMIHEIHTATQQSADIVRQLLAYARKQIISPEPLDLNDTLSPLLKMLQRLIGENIDLTWHPGKNLWQVKIDPAQVDQIMANLATNSRDAISDVGKLTVETKNTVVDEDYCKTNRDAIPGRYVMLAVSDNGCGMEKGIMDQIFEPYFTTKEVGKGSGLGLPTIFGIVKQNKGFLNVYSEIGEGTTFKLYFPSHEADISSVHAAKEFRGDIPGGTETILIVEDEKALLQASRRILESRGYTVLIAESPGEALTYCNEYDGTIDLLLTDVVMPDMNGSDLASQMAMIRPGLKTLYMSGYAANAIIHHGVLDEGVLFIQKPFSLKDLAAKVRKAIEQG